MSEKVVKMKVSEAQRLIREMYGERDSRRGILGTSLHLGEEIGELFRAIRSRNHENIEDELADSLAWLLSVSELLEVDLEAAFLRRYGRGCPKCFSIPCRCPEV